MDLMLHGFIAMGWLVAALHFLRFWHTSKDRFFLYFAISFALEVGNRIHTVWARALQEDGPQNYLIRLVSYGLILYAIWAKNRKSRAGSL
jgi:hypothetical protein